MPKGKGKAPRPEIIPPPPLTAPVPELFTDADRQLPGAVQWVRRGIKELIQKAYYIGYNDGYAHGYQDGTDHGHVNA